MDKLTNIVPSSVADSRHPSSLATIMSPFMAKSTGIPSQLISSLQYMDLITPFPAATTIPVGPFKLSTQPGNGSFQALITEELIEHQFILFVRTKLVKINGGFGCNFDIFY